MTNTTNKYGMVTWDEVEIATNTPNQSRRDLYLRLDAGSNEVRVLTKPHEFLMHKYKTHPDDPGYGERVLSSIFHGRDPLMEKGLKPKRRWLLGVIDRKTQSYKILDVGPAVFKGVQKLVRNEKWGDPSQYDIDIQVDKAGGPSGYYTVIPMGHTPLSPSDLEIKQMADLEELKRKCTPPTPEEVDQRVAAIDAKSKSRQGNATSPSADDAEDSETDFPAVEGSAQA
ncbi:MAG TPA: hypothetical protein VMW91_05690 [Desulfosporosinus sp.]|nr:hypothetical protein [Desulfosporosinus sp.]